MYFRQIVRNASGCASYIIGCSATGSAAVIDPLAELGATEYILEAYDRGLRIHQVIDTHVHADHVSAARELAALAHCPVYMHESAVVHFPFEPLTEDQEIPVGNITLQVIHTPGHTPESICLIVKDTPRADRPWFVLTGDTLFVGDVGRPDLILEDAADTGDSTSQRVENLYDSLFHKLLSQDDLLEIYPAHFGGSACGGLNMSGKPSSTLGFERRFNLALQQPSREAFVQFVLENLKPQPPNYQEIKRRNMEGGS